MIDDEMDHQLVLMENTKIAYPVRGFCKLEPASGKWFAAFIMFNNRLDYTHLGFQGYLSK